MDSIYDTPEYKERWAMYQSALDAGIPIVSTETCAIICAMLLVWGNTAEFTHNHRLVCELQYAQKRFGIEGGSGKLHDSRLRIYRVNFKTHGDKIVKT